MKVVIAIDSLKGSLTSLEAGEAIKEGIQRAVDAKIEIKPLADGGEGTMEALIDGLGGVYVPIHVMGPLGNTIESCYGYLEETRTAIIEMAKVAGIMLVKDKEDPLIATTYGMGEIIRDAIGRGCRSFIVGIGGSATNDGGVGMLMALGYEFLDRYKKPVKLGGRGLAEITQIRTEHVMKELQECHFRIACDVTNPLCGEHGATYIYGPQKGITNSMKLQLDKDMLHYAKLTKEAMHCDYLNTAGAGAAGGMGFAFKSYLNAELISGIDLVLETIRLEESIADADYVVTGEGRLDMQTSMGKAPVGVARMAKKYHVKVIAFAGSVSKEAVRCNDEGIDAYFPILRTIETLEEAMKKTNARNNLADTAEQVFRLIYAQAMSPVHR